VLSPGGLLLHLAAALPLPDSCVVCPETSVPRKHNTSLIYVIYGNRLNKEKYKFLVVYLVTMSVTLITALNEWMMVNN
jgi:hypothetical protein